ncbi:MAG: DUF523 domain-containing protein [Candidatus Aenigmarchaeota archaeon]|nr:DUF523 domain-containing protein [Candidatus Aenigmarchaeota archaeon]
MQRGKKIVFVSHCILNQNAAAMGKAKQPGVFKDILDILGEAGIGLIQMGCPEMEFGSGLNRKPRSKSSYDTKSYRTLCKKMAQDVIKQIELYLSKNYKVVGILGVEFSPTCAVYQIEEGNRNVPGKGILIEEIEEEMRKKRFQIPILGINPNNTNSSIEKLQSLLRYG